MRILIADDHVVVRRGLRQLLTLQPGWEICAEARTGREAVALAKEHNPDVVVMDISMPDLDGLEAIRQIREFRPNAKIAVLTMHFSDQLLHDVVAAGARAYVMKSDATDNLVSALEALSNNFTYFNSRSSDGLLSGSCIEISDTASGNAVGRLSSRQREVVQLVAEGKTNRVVASTLSISEKTAETHRANIMRKLKLHSVTDLVRYALRNRIIEV